MNFLKETNVLNKILRKIVIFYCDIILKTKRDCN